MNYKKNTKPQRLVPIWLRIALAVSAIFGVLYFSIVPPPGSGAISRGPIGFIPYSYWLHFASYTGLAILMGYATAHVPRPDWQLWVFTLAVGTGITIELLQYTIATRTFSLLDIVANTVGVSFGILLLTIVDRLASSSH